MAAVVDSSGSRSPTIEDLGFVKPLWWIVVASGGSKSSDIEDLGVFKPLWRIVVAIPPLRVVAKPGITDAG